MDRVKERIMRKKGIGKEKKCERGKEIIMRKRVRERKLFKRGTERISRKT